MTLPLFVDINVTLLLLIRINILDKKALLHAKRWYLYLNEREKLVKGKYWWKLWGTIRKRYFGKVVGDHEVEDTCDHEDIRLRGLDFNIFDEDEEGVVR